MPLTSADQHRYNNYNHHDHAQPLSGARVNTDIDRTYYSSSLLSLSLSPSPSPTPPSSASPRRSNLLPHSRNSSTASSSMALFRIRSDQYATRSGSQRRRRQMRLLSSYSVDWLVTIILAAVFFSLDSVHGFRREFSIEDPTISFPFAEHERVPPVALYFIAVVSPFVIQIAINVLTVRTFWDFHNSTLGLLLALVLAGAVTQFTKITVGRPRPDLLSRCNPPSGITNPEYGLVTDAICRAAKESILRDGFRSFPSGHSSLSFAGLGHLSFYTAGKLHLFDEKGHTTKAWLSLTPLAAAALVAISRTMDYRHHWQDVLVGSLLGLTMAFFAYRQYYPPLGSQRSHKPFSPRVPNESREEGAGGAGMSGDSARTDAGRPILPTTRAEGEGLGMGGEARGRREEGEGEGIGMLTHPPNPHMHFMHGSSPFGEYRDDEHVHAGADTDAEAGAALMRPGTSFDSAVKGEESGIELNRSM